MAGLYSNARPEVAHLLDLPRTIAEVMDVKLKEPMDGISFL